MESREIQKRIFNWAVVIVLASAALVGCGGKVNGDLGTNDELASTEPITDVSHTPAKKQSIGNCWAYAACTWAESLHKGHAGEDLNLSESWISYWHWFEQIANDGERNEVQTGGHWGVAVELMLRYGVISEGDFVPEEANVERSQRQKDALNAINASLKSGVLASGRVTRALIRQELDKAWSLTPEVSARMTKAFGAGVSRTLDRSRISLAGTNVRRAKDIAIGKAGSKEITLADAIGTRSSWWNPNIRTGTHAWSEVDYPSSQSSRRTVQTRMQKALHDKKPVVVTWFVDFAAMSAGKFEKPPVTIGRQGGHVVVMEDYEIDNVPGFGTLKAGVMETRPEALEAALDSSATIKFFRIKNSWGSQQELPTFPDGGHHDLYLDYMNGPIEQCTQRAAEPAGLPADQRACISSSPTVPLESFVLPPGY